MVVWGAVFTCFLAMYLMASRIEAPAANDLKTLPWFVATPVLKDMKHLNKGRLRWNTVDIDEPVGDYISKHGVVWYRTVLPPDWIKPGKAILLERLNDADEVYLNDEKIGQTGAIYNTAREYRGVAPAYVARFYSLPASPENIDLAGPAVLEIKMQANFYRSSPGSGHILLGKSYELRRFADRLNAPARLRDSFILVLLIICSGVGLANMSGHNFDYRSRWMAPFFLSLAVAVFPSTLLAYEFLIYTPIIVQLCELSPVVPLALLHIGAITSTRILAIQWAIIIALYVALLAPYLFNFDVAYLLKFNIVQSVLVLFAFIPSLRFAILAVQDGHKVSKWSYLALSSMLAGVLCYAVFGQIIAPLWDPLGLAVIATGCCSLMAMTEHSAWDRRDLQKATGKILDAQDAEREKLARGLHDEVSHQLLASRLQLEVFLRQDGGANKADIQLVSEDLRKLGLDISALIEGLRPVALEEMTFVDIINHMAERWSRVGKLSVVTFLEDDLCIPEEVRFHILRILQEALLNVVRHSDAEIVEVHCHTHGRWCVLLVSDNGHGFPVENTHPGIGLGSMRERVKLIGGDLAVVSRPGGGCRAEVRFPLK